MLGLLAVKPALPQERYACRLRELVGSAVEVARGADFDHGDVPLELLPGWFRDVTDGTVGPPESWDVEEWGLLLRPRVAGLVLVDLTDEDATRWQAQRSVGVGG